jgi:uncharacterized protein YqeY
MMTLQKQINEDWKNSIKNKDVALKKALTFMRSKLQEQAKKSKLDVLSDTDVIKVLRKMEKEQQDFVNNYGGEEAIYELSVINSYLPQLMSEEQTKVAVEAYVAGLDFAPTSSDFGKVMGPLMKDLMGKADGKLVRKALMEILN